MKSFSRLMNSISSRSHNNFYCYNCFNSFRTELVLKKHMELCKNNNSCETNLPKPGKNFKYHKPGSKSLKLNNVIYAAFEILLIPYQKCDNKITIIQDLNKHKVCGYSINVVSNHTKQNKRTYYRGKDSLVQFCKEICKIGTSLIDTEIIPMKKLNKEQQDNYDNANYCYIRKKIFSNNHKNLIKVRDHDHYTQVIIEVQLIQFVI